MNVSLSGRVVQGQCSCPSNAKTVVGLEKTTTVWRELAVPRSNNRNADHPMMRSRPWPYSEHDVSHLWHPLHTP